MPQKRVHIPVMLAITTNVEEGETHKAVRIRVVNAMLARDSEKQHGFSFDEPLPEGFYTPRVYASDADVKAAGKTVGRRVDD